MQGLANKWEKYKNCSTWIATLTRVLKYAQKHQTIAVDVDTLEVLNELKSIKSPNVYLTDRKTNIIYRHPSKMVTYNRKTCRY